MNYTVYSSAGYGSIRCMICQFALKFAEFARNNYDGKLVELESQFARNVIFIK